MIKYASEAEINKQRHEHSEQMTWFGHVQGPEDLAINKAETSSMVRMTYLSWQEGHGRNGNRFFFFNEFCSTGEEEMIPEFVDDYYKRFCMLTEIIL